MRLVMFLAGAAMAGSYFVTWVEPPFAGQEFSPAAVIGDTYQEIIDSGTWQARVFLAGFALAALTALVAILGRASGLLAILAGASPLALGVHYYLQAEDIGSDIGLPFQVSLQDLGQAWELVGDFVRAGLWMYLGGALLLLLLGMTRSFGSR
ncbi:hypothetical protein [Hasllibacter sp. MH4015]|uniref:hypothetical protein n=1 Tax=Hasllibacter sp. MH4015 TaxID=2854029 RepID=UPI001CD41852|nr:hypothetical protein [Hasllibacter sp. MH4015]